MKKFYYLGALTTLLGTIVLGFVLVQHIQNAAIPSTDLVLSSGILCLGSIIMTTNKCQEVK